MLRALFLTILLTITVQSGNAAELSVRIQDAPDSGTIVLNLFNSANSFGDFRDPVRVEKYAFDDGDTFTIRDLSTGDYALLAYHDKNSNNELDRNFIGIPNEPVGFSNGYLPKGPPNYQRAVFTLQKNEVKEMELDLFLPLGPRGRIGAGIGIIGRSTPYQDYSSNAITPIPAITYIGDRLQILGPKIQWGLSTRGKAKLAAIGNLRIGAYKEEKSNFLQGMGDRETTFMAGLALKYELPQGIKLTAGFEHDVLNKIDGSSASLELGKSFQFGKFVFSSDLGMNWLSASLTNHDFGVPEDKATAFRPAYQLNDSSSIEATLGMFFEITDDWRVIVNLTWEFLNDDITNSPLVSDDHVIKGFTAVNYVF